jgi:voltage-gated potassium channel
MTDERQWTDIRRRIQLAVIALALVLVAGSVGYYALGFSLIDAVYQTVTTVSTVGFREVHPFDTVGKAFTIVLILAGVGIALYTFGVVLEALIEGHLGRHFERRKMSRELSRASGHIIICGWGRVGRSVGDHLVAAGQQIVVIDRNADRIADLTQLTVVGDVTDDAVLNGAGLSKARALVAALDTDADNVYVTLSARALRPDLVIISRARNDASEAKLIRAGADRVVNPQRSGGRRMANLTLQPHVVDFWDDVMYGHDAGFRLEEIEIAPTSDLAGRTLRQAALHETTGALLIAIRSKTGVFVPNPPLDSQVEAGLVLIAAGTLDQLRALHHRAESVS